jgi:hypothetical protein
MVKASLRSLRKDAATKAAVVDAKAVVTVDSKPVVVADPVDVATVEGLENMVGEADQAPQQESKALVPRSSNTAVAVRNQFADSGFEGDWGADDLKFPQVKLVQGSGERSTQFDEGTLVLRFVPVHIKKQFREKLTQEDFQNGVMPRIVDTVAEVEELGGTTRWVGREQPDNYWEPSSRCLLLIELPEGSDHPGFPLELDGKFYAVAVYYAAGGAFREFSKVIFNAAPVSLLVPVLNEDGTPAKDERTNRPLKKSLLWKCFWTVNWARKAAGNFNPWRPNTKLCKEEAGPDVRAYCEQLRQNIPSAAVEE